MAVNTFTYSQYRQRKTIRYTIIGILMVVLIYFSSISAKVDFRIFFRDNSQTLRLLSDFLSPKWAVLPEMIVAAFQTLLLALLGTIIGTAISFFFAIYAANNISSRWSNLVSRFLIALERSISEVLIILLLIAIFGLGMFPGVLAIAISCIGMLGKLFAEAMEEIPGKTLDAIRSTGANKAQLILFGVIPEIAPSLISNTILRFEINIRTSVLLGAIGAGGIGYELQKAYRYIEYGEMTVAVLTILVLVFASEQVSIWLRSRLLNDEKLS